MRNHYKAATKTLDLQSNSTPKEKRKKIVEKFKAFGEKIFGKRERYERLQDPVLKTLPEDRIEIKKDQLPHRQITTKNKCHILKNIKKKMKKQIKSKNTN